MEVKIWEKKYNYHPKCNGCKESIEVGDKYVYYYRYGGKFHLVCVVDLILSELEENERHDFTTNWRIKKMLNRLVENNTTEIFAHRL